MTTSEPLDTLRERIAQFRTDPYLLTVTAANHPHCATVTPVWDKTGTRIFTRAPSSWPDSEASGRVAVSLLWPPATTGGYSLIVDGTATAEAADCEPGKLAITLTRAVLHRRGAARPDSNSSCGSDCVPLFAA